MTDRYTVRTIKTVKDSTMSKHKSNYSNGYLITQRGFHAVITAGKYASRTLYTVVTVGVLEEYKPARCNVLTLQLYNKHYSNNLKSRRVALNVKG